MNKHLEMDGSEVPVSVSTASSNEEEQPQLPAFKNSSINTDSEILGKIPLYDDSPLTIVDSKTLSKIPLLDEVSPTEQPSNLDVIKDKDGSEVSVSVSTASSKEEEQLQLPAFSNSSINTDSEILGKIPLHDDLPIIIVDCETVSKIPLLDEVSPTEQPSNLYFIKDKIKAPTKKQKFINFRKLLLTKCQKEFEQDKTDEIKHEERIKALEVADPEKKKELEQEMYDEEKKMRYRKLGNIRFIGELFKLGMLIGPIIHECIKRLLSQGDEESLEGLCLLLKTVGKELDEGKNKNSKESMESYFTYMQKIVHKRLTSSRVRFMLQDVIDLKKNNWVPRRVEDTPKTIDQIHKEAKREARERQQVLQNMFFNKRIPDERDRRKTRIQVTLEKGWTSFTESNKGSYSIIDPNKLKLTKPDEVDSIRAMQSWGHGNSGGMKIPDVSSDPEKNYYKQEYDDVIIEESLKNLEQSNDENEAEGKGVALHSLKSFFHLFKRN